MIPAPITGASSRRCAQVTKKGQCQAHALKGSDVCFWHSTDPEIIAQRAKASSKGGRANAMTGLAGWEDITIQGPEDLKRIAGTTINAVLSGKLHPSAANAVAGLLGQYGRLIELSDIESRITKLEGIVNERKQS